MKHWKAWYVGIALIFILSVSAGAVVLSYAPDCGLTKIKTVDDLAKRFVRLQWAIGDPSPVDGEDLAESCLRGFTEYRQSYIDQAGRAEVVILARATGDLDINNRTLGQRVIVEKVLHGECDTAVGADCWAWHSDTLREEKGEIVYTGVLNLMQPGQTYMLFLEASAFNGVTRRQNYRLCGPTQFQYIPVPYTPETALPDGVRKRDFDEWADYPSFVASPEIAEARSEIAEYLLAMFLRG